MNEATQIFPSDKRAMQEVSALLEQEGIRLDRNLDYTCAIRDSEGRLIATGSLFQNTMRCFAVDHRHRGEGLLNRVISHLMEQELERGNLDLFLYTKGASARFFHDLGFYEIARVPDRLVFMENQPDGFRHCLSRFERETQAFLAERGIAGFGNVVLHASGPYIISNATFPSYFLPDDDAASVGHAELDLTLFAKIAAAKSPSARSRASTTR